MIFNESEWDKMWMSIRGSARLDKTHFSIV